MAKKSKPKTRKVAKQKTRKAAAAAATVADGAPITDAVPPHLDDGARADGAEEPEAELEKPRVEATEPQAEAMPSDGDQAVDGAQTDLPLGDALDRETAPGDSLPEADQPSPEGSRLESIIESLLFASARALGLSDLKRLLGERDGKKITAALEALQEKRANSGIQVVALASGWHLRTHPENAAWVSKLLAGRPLRLSRAMLETLAIVAYRQPITRPEVDDIRGVDCGPVLKTLLDRGLVRILGKKEEVGRPMLYGTTPEFLRVFSLRDLAELPTLREFYDLSAEDQSRVDAEHGEPPAPPSATSPKPDVSLGSVARGALAPEPEDTDPLLDELDQASAAAKQALGDLAPNQEDARSEEPQREGAADPSVEPDPSGHTSE
jgi:segregation and condensation protein B